MTVFRADTGSSDIARRAREQLVTRRIDPSLSEKLGDEPPDTPFPWILLHRGRCLCRLRSDFAHAQLFIDAALTAFRRAGDSEGELWALVERVVLCYHNREFNEGLAVLDLFDVRGLQPYLRSELLFGRFLCYIGLDLLRDAENTGYAALAALDDERDPWLQRLGRIQMLRNQAAAYHYLGKARLSARAAEEALSLAGEHSDTADSEPWCCYELGLAYWRNGEFALAATTLDRARRLAESWRHHELWRWAVATEGHMLRDQGQLVEARQAYMLADSWGEDIHGPILLQIREGRLAEARWACEAMVNLAQRQGSPVYEADGRVLLGLVTLRGGDAHMALELFDSGCATYSELGYIYNLASVRYYQASALLALGHNAEANTKLSEALAFSATEGVYNTDWWMPELMHILLVRAIQQRIEPQHAQRMLERRFLSAPVTPSPVEVGSLVKNELDIARQTQLNLLPSAPPFMPDLDIAGMSVPSEEVGGDFYGFYPAGANPTSGNVRQLGLAVSDISGKGLQSALLTSGTAVAISTAVADQPQPSALLSAVHRALHPYTTRSRLYVALCYVVLTQQQNHWALTAANAGALPPLIRRQDGRIEWLDIGGLPLGSMMLGQYSEATTALLPGDVVVLMSDGIIEAMNHQRELFGIDQFERALAAAPVDQGARAVIQHLFAAVQAYAANAPQHDDITLVVVRIEAAAPEMR